MTIRPTNLKAGMGVRYAGRRRLEYLERDRDTSIRRDYLTGLYPGSSVVFNRRA